MRISERAIPLVLYINFVVNFYLLPSRVEAITLGTNTTQGKTFLKRKYEYILCSFWDGFSSIHSGRVERVKDLTRFPFNFPRVEFMMDAIHAREELNLGLKISVTVKSLFCFLFP